MDIFLTYLLMRVIVVAAVAVGLAILLTVVVVLVRRAGRLDDAKRLAAPLARGLGERAGVWGAVGRGATHLIDDRHGDARADGR